MSQHGSSSTPDPCAYSRTASSICRELDEVIQSSPALSITPDVLNTAFTNETTSAEHSQLSLSQSQSQTTQEASSAIRGLINTITNEEDERISLILSRTPIKILTDTLPKTPTMVSIGMMINTPIMTSIGTMPETPTMVSTGTMPRTPITISTGTMPKTPLTIDLVSPIRETIVVSSPDTPTNTGSPK